VKNTHFFGRNKIIDSLSPLLFVKRSEAYVASEKTKVFLTERRGERE
jgi:hypothetical protein